MEIIKEVEKNWEKEFRSHLTDGHGWEVQLLVKTFEKFLHNKEDVDSLLFEAKAVAERTWEKLNVGMWSKIPEETKQVYAIASYIQVFGLLHKNETENLKKCLEIIDRGILLGCPFRSLSLTKIADILSSKIQEAPVAESAQRQNPPERRPQKKLKLTNEIETVSCPSLEFFKSNFFDKLRPVKLTDCIDHWPALNLWKNLNYIIKKVGHRTVPVELGRHYADKSHSQKLMTVSDFVTKYFDENAEEIGYLAQHQLFDQVPELKKDITEPDYCALSDKLESSCETEINAWFGPKGTVSPLHFDPKHNLLCQVVGTKKIILYSPEYKEFLYPHEGSILFNTSRVDVEDPDHALFPEFAKAVKEECLLSPGDMLYIPPKYWHHVRSLENSFSVSFWWE